VEFRWVAIITLWTFISGPAVGPPTAKSSPSCQSGNKKVIKHTRQQTGRGPHVTLSKRAL
jgi:hypothetical protein